MLDIVQIENTIQELENSVTTFDTCIKLSALYNVREHLQNATRAMVTNDNTAKELYDILPSYKRYIEIKQAYQLGTGNPEAVRQAFNNVCQEIQEFILALYSGTDMPEERFLLYNTIQDLVPRIQQS